jgi:hypothetical protein
MVSSVGYGTAAAPSTHRPSVSGDASAETAQTGAVRQDVKEDAKQNLQAKAAQPGVTVSISPEGAAAATRAQKADDSDRADSAAANTTTTDASTSATADTDATMGEPSTGSSGVSPVKAFAYGALGLERPDQPQDERNAFYTAGKWLAAGLTIGGLISLLV